MRRPEGPGFTRPITQNAEQVPRSQRWWNPASWPTDPRFATNTDVNIGSGSIIARGSNPNRSSRSAPRTSAKSLSGDDCRLKIVARNGVGYDNVDLAAATAKGVVVTNTPLAVRRPVAVATLTMLFALAGRLFKKHELVQTGRWNDRQNFMGLGLTRRTLGLVGAGGIGQDI